VTARDAAIAALSPACRARTILAAGTWLPWRTEDNAQHAPYLDQDGTPLLLVERASADALLTAGLVSVESDALPELGVLRLRGSVWPAVGNGQLAALRQFRAEHATCADCCGPLRTSLVGVRIDAVTLATGGAPAPVDLDAYVEARPDPVIARSLRVRMHLNTDHPDDLLVLASRLFGRPRDEIAAVSVEWIDNLGLDLSVIDQDGAASVRLPFRVPLTTMDDLGGRLHHLLHEAA
jgi:uncharacterized protein DUF2470